MNNTIVAGLQWGDEGKGKIVDWLAERSDVIVRFQGGNNAGHTLVMDGKVFKLSMLPSGVVRDGKFNIIGNGVVLDPWAFLAEVDALSVKGIVISSHNLVVSEHAPLILPLHRELDSLRETRAGSGKIGTTGRGIGPAYEDKIGRRALRVADLRSPESVELMLNKSLDHHNALRAGLGAEPVDRRQLETRLMEIAERLLKFAGPASQILRDRMRQGQSVLFEGAQGAMLDVDHGTYPFVTSSNTLPAAAAAGAGVGASQLGRVIGVCKTYTTRVGSGPFPTELSDATGAHLASVGKEKGTVTGRDRRCGWFDAVAVRQICQTARVDGLALTKLDVLDALPTVRICTGYRLDGEEIDRIPATVTEQFRLEPVYEDFPGWMGSTAGCRSLGDLPSNAQRFISRIEELTGTPVEIISTSPDRSDTTAIAGPFA